MLGIFKIMEVLKHERETPMKEDTISQKGRNWQQVAEQPKGCWTLMSCCCRRIASVL